jgi:ribosomal protein S7
VVAGCDRVRSPDLSGHLVERVGSDDQLAVDVDPGRRDTAAVRRIMITVSNHDAQLAIQWDAEIHSLCDRLALRADELGRRI